MYSNEVGGCFWDLCFLEECTVFILHGVKLLHFQRLADKHNQIKTQMWISRVSKWWSPYVPSFRTALSWPVCQRIHCQTLTRWTAPVIARANQTATRWTAARCHLKLFKRAEQAPASVCEPVWCADSSRGFWKFSEAEAPLAIVHVCFPVQLTCGEGSSLRIRLPTPPNVLTNTHTGSCEATSDFNLATITVVWKCYKEACTDS